MEAVRKNRALRGNSLPSGLHSVVFDVGETLVDESRAWADQARRVGVTPFTLMGLLGALACLQTAKTAGLVVGIAGNQPAGVEAQLRAAGFKADFIASSAAWGVMKPSADFFSRTVRAANVAAREILYVGDRLDNDVLPAREAGMRTAFIRRGPWGYVHSQRREVALADLQIDSLAELTGLFT